MSGSKKAFVVAVILLVWGSIFLELRWSASSVWLLAPLGAAAIGSCILIARDCLPPLLRPWLRRAELISEGETAEGSVVTTFGIRRRYAQLGAAVGMGIGAGVFFDELPVLLRSISIACVFVACIIPWVLLRCPACEASVYYIRRGRTLEYFWPGSPLWNPERCRDCGARLL